MKDLDKVALALARACTIIINDDYDAETLRETIYSKVSKEWLSQSIATINELAREPGDNIYQEMLEQYRKVCRFLPHLLEYIEFSSSLAGEELNNAMEYFRSLRRGNKWKLKDAPLGVITKSWKKMINSEDSLSSKRGYTLCVLEQIQDKLRRRDIYVESSARWGDSRKKLLQGSEWETIKHQVTRTLGHSLKANETIQDLSKELDEAYFSANSNFNTNNKVRIE